MTVDDKVPLVQWVTLSRSSAVMYVARSWGEVTGRAVVSSRAWCREPVANRAISRLRSSAGSGCHWALNVVTYHESPRNFRTSLPRLCTSGLG
jgi:hypothetical protein